MRIASLLPSATELLFAIGAGPEVVGVTHECDFPAEARGLPRLTASSIDHQGRSCAAIDRHIRGALHSGSSIYRLDEELLARLRPDLIVTQELCEVCAVAYREVEGAARRLGGEVPVISLEPTCLGGIVATALVLGRATGRVTGAEAVAARLREAIAAVGSLAPFAPVPTPTACLEWTDPIFAGGHWVPEMVRLAGGRDVLGVEGERSAEVAWERVVEAAPELMVLMPCGFGLERSLETVADLERRPGFRDLPCAATGRIAAVDGSGYFNRPGPRIVDGLRILAAVLRADPGSPLPAGAAWVRLSGREAGSSDL
jgi:iron complex transport system substrate-binding protein